MGGLQLNVLSDWHVQVSDTHVDAWCSNFYMALLRGRKRWTLFRRADTPRLYFDHFTSSFELNVTALRQRGNPGNPGDTTDDADDDGGGLCLTADTLERYPLARGTATSTSFLTPPGFFHQRRHHRPRAWSTSRCGSDSF